MPDTPNATPTNYNSAYTGPQIDAAVGAVLDKEAVWDDAAAGKLPAGGEVGQILEKTGAEDNAAEWRTPPFLVRRNLFDNWYFVGGGSQLGTGTFPINQRGQTIKTGTGYFIDRWRINGYNSTSSVLSVEDGLEVTGASSSGASGIRQVFSSPIPSGTVLTVSMMVTLGENATGIGIRLYHPDGSYDQLASTDMTVDGELRWGTITLTGTCTTVLFRIIPNISSVAFKAVKIEIGNYQTLAHKENGMWMLNEFPNFGEELLKCQRYFLSLDVGSACGPTRFSTVTIDWPIPTPIKMASLPTLSGNPIVLKRGVNTIADAETGFTFTITSYGNSTVVVRGSKTSHELGDDYPRLVLTDCYLTCEP